MKKQTILILVVILIIIIILFFTIKKSPISMSCENIISNIYELKEKINYCNYNEDCAISTEFTGCHIGCYLLFNKNENIEDLKLSINLLFKEKCSEGCFKNCPEPLNETKIICKNNKCIDSRFES